MKTFTQQTAWGATIDGLFLTDLKTLQICRMEDGYPEPWCTAASNIPGLQTGEVAIKNYSENQGILPALLAAGIVKEPHRHIAMGMILHPICYINEEVAREYTRG